MRPIVAILLLAAVPTIGAAAVYRWVDAQGNVHFGDTPVPGAEEVHVPPPQTYTPAPAPAIAPVPKPPEAPTHYSQFTIAAPAPEENIWENTGAVAVTFDIQPELNTKSGHQVVVLLDGQPTTRVAASSAVLNGVERGSHSLQGQVVDPAGTILATTPVITVHVHRQSIHQPNRARPPAPNPKPRPAPR